MKTDKGDWLKIYSEPPALIPPSLLSFPTELAFTPALTLTDAEYQAAERVTFAAEAMGEHVLIKSEPKQTGESPRMAAMRIEIDGIKSIITELRDDSSEATK